jgi:hypothetical protein
VYPVGCGLDVAQHRGADILASKHLEVVPEHLLPLGNLPMAGTITGFGRGPASGTSRFRSWANYVFELSKEQTRFPKKGETILVDEEEGSASLMARVGSE